VVSAAGNFTGVLRMSVVESLLRELKEQTCDLRCRNVPTGGDVPKEREIGFGEDPTEAMMMAFHGIGYSDLDHSEIGI